MNEHVITAIFTRDEAETFFAVEEFYRALTFTDHLCRHLWARATVEAAGSTAAKPATTRAAIAAATVATAKTATPAAAKIPVKSARTRGIKSASPVEILAKIITFAASALSTALAAIPIKTHTLVNTQLSSGLNWPAAADGSKRATIPGICPRLVGCIDYSGQSTKKKAHSSALHAQRVCTAAIAASAWRP
jgi:hypothetical protein